ncbi:MAG: sulfatase, partial [Alphaproteobacteria bacterium]
MLDPAESCNIVDAPETQGVLAEMRNRLEQWMAATDDPLLSGPVPKPERAAVNDPTDVGPKDIWQRIPRPEGFS